MTHRSEAMPKTLWVLERVTALCLIPLAGWLAFHLPGFQTLSQEAFLQWCREPLHVSLLGGFLIIASLHARLGLDTILEDYVSDPVQRRRGRWLSGLIIHGSLSIALLSLGAMILGTTS